MRPLGTLSLQNPDAAGDVRRVTAWVQESLSKHGYAYLCDVPERFDHIAFLGQFGAFLPQYDGKKVWDLRPEPDMDDVYHSMNTRALLPHTEAYEYAGQPPRYLALWCLHQAEGPGGETTLADGSEWLKSFSDQELEIMRTRPYEWRSTEGLARMGIHWQTSHRILEEDRGREILRYSANNVMSVDDDGFLPRFIESGLEFFDRTHVAVRIERNGLLLWDNWRMMHSRTAFKDPGRHLKRVLISA